MTFSRLSILFNSLTILLAGPALMMPHSNLAHGQLFKNSMASNVSQSDFFVVITSEGGSSMGLLGLFGVTDSSAETTYHFGMRDENGYQYETLDLIKPQVVEELGLTKDQVDVIGGIKRSAYADLADMISDGRRMFAEASEGTISAAEIESDYKKSLEDKFYSALTDIKSTLSEEQLTRLEQMQHRNGIRQLGLARYLCSPHFGDSISEADAKVIEDVAVEYGKLLKSDSLELLKAANQKLLCELKSDQQTQFSAEFDSEFTDKFLATQMFTKRYSTKRRVAKRKTDLYRVLKLKKVRTSIGLSEDEYSEIKKLDDNQRDELPKKLTYAQSIKLDETIVLTDLRRMGTVNSIACGHLREVLEIDDEQAERLCAAGKKISGELAEQLVSMKKEAFRKATRVLSRPLQRSLEKMLGDSVVELPGLE